jgi:hypothetical protein
MIAAERERHTSTHKWHTCIHLILKAKAHMHQTIQRQVSGSLAVSQSQCLLVFLLVVFLLCDLIAKTQTHTCTVHAVAATLASSSAAAPAFLQGPAAIARSVQD